MSICTKATLIPKFTIFSGAISLASLQLEVGQVATAIFLLKYFKTSWDKYAHPLCSNIPRLFKYNVGFILVLFKLLRIS
ncbi:MAG: hypothetical protein LBD56_00475 [Endomicrobium sp.]|jgi:hypothetical protein|nr:hypothetical protein [Endomicrobium sp.]